MISPDPSALLKLSICITTFNRAGFIGATLDSILSQVTNDCEVLVLDGASMDDTRQVVDDYANRYECLRYVRRDENFGLDRDCDCAVSLARGQFCWLMTDDDLMKPGALVAVLDQLRPEVSLVIVNAESTDFNVTTVVRDRWLEFDDDRIYLPDEMDRLFHEASAVLRFIGSFVIRREIWMKRNKEPYFGSLFIHLGVVFQDRLPGKGIAIARPLITYRMGNSHTFSTRMFETFMVKFPTVVWSLNLATTAKNRVCEMEPWRNLSELFWWRGAGFYSIQEYRLWIRPRVRSTLDGLPLILVALLPGVLVNTILVWRYALRKGQGGRLQTLRESRFHLSNLGRERRSVAS